MKDMAEFIDVTDGGPTGAPTGAAVGQRGPVEHERRAQILKAADEHFRHYGYSKTSVAALGREIGVSAAYIYRFFDSKQAIGEAVVAQVLGEMDAGLHEIAVGPEPATARLRRLLLAMMQCSCERFLEDRKVHEIVVVATENNWCATVDHQHAVENAIRQVIIDGRASGEFERKSPLDEICGAIVAASLCFSHPKLLESESNEELERRLTIVTSLVLRSLAP
jgi:AcrR family transcriptional regulator